MRLLDLIEQAKRVPLHQATGTVKEVVGLIVEVVGITAAVGDTLTVETATGRLELEVVGFRAGLLLTTPLGPIVGVRPGALVWRSFGGATTPVGPELLGRVLDALGRPMDEMPLPPGMATATVHGTPPSPFSRRPIDRQFATGLRVIDAMLPLGIGQRMGIFAGAGVGKSTLLGQICRSSDADVNVVALIGERGRELNDFLRNSLGPEGLARSVIIAATSDQPPLVRARGAIAATAVAEYFRDQGKKVLLVMDSVTRYAMALREAALAAGEPPATKGYPPSVFAALPRLLERTGTGAGEGTITALYTVLVEGDDLTDPIADAVRGILDGHIVLSRQIAERGHFPAIDVLQSVSRLAPEIAPTSTLMAASQVRQWLGAHREAQDLIQVGAYVKGSDPMVETALALMPKMDAFLRQGMREHTTKEQAVAQLVALVAQGERERKGASKR